MTRILLTGRTGTLGSAMWRSLRERGAVTGIARKSLQEGVRLCDLTDPAAVRTMLDEVRPNLILHLAAKTDVDACETAPADAYALNARATQSLAEWCLKTAPNTRFIYISTDQVYDAPGPSSEDKVTPRNVYALTKLWGEDHARRLTRHTVLRVNFFTGHTASGKGLVPWLIAQARSHQPVKLFTDVLFNPLHVSHLAELIAETIDRDVTGTFNLGASGRGLSKAAFLRLAAQRLGLPDDNFRDGSVEDANLTAYRPRDMRMDITRAEHALGHTLPGTEEGLDLLVAEHAQSLK